MLVLSDWPMHTEIAFACLEVWLKILVPNPLWVHDIYFGVKDCDKRKDAWWNCWSECWYRGALERLVFFVLFPHCIIEHNCHYLPYCHLAARLLFQPQLHQGHPSTWIENINETHPLQPWITNRRINSSGVKGDHVLSLLNMIIRSEETEGQASLHLYPLTKLRICTKGDCTLSREPLLVGKFLSSHTFSIFYFIVSFEFRFRYLGGLACG